MQCGLIFVGYGYTIIIICVDEQAALRWLLPLSCQQQKKWTTACHVYPTCTGVALVKVGLELCGLHRCDGERVLSLVKRLGSKCCGMVFDWDRTLCTTKTGAAPVVGKQL